MDPCLPTASWRPDFPRITRLIAAGQFDPLQPHKTIFTLFSMKALPASLALLSLASLAAAPTEPAIKPAVESSSGQYVFSLLPKAFQKNPLVDETVITEMTPAGKLVAPPTTARPAYYVIESGGYHVIGHGSANEHPPQPEALRVVMFQTLSAAHYLPATATQSPSLLLVYHWGSHNTLEGGDENTPGLDDVRHANLLSRAALVGGVRFARELRAALDDQDAQDEAASYAPAGFDSTAVDFKPLEHFMDRDDRNRQLVAQAQVNCYYLIVSAYDYRSVVQGKRQLLWRTKMTVDAQGVAMADTLPGLIVNAGKYFGQDMSVAATLSKHVSPEGRVDLGELEFKAYLPASETQKSADPKSPPR
jgi:hypothetical protein